VGLGVDVDAGFQKLVNQAALVVENPGSWRWLAVDVTYRHGAFGLGGLVEFCESFDANWTVLRHEMQVTLDLVGVKFTVVRPQAARE
jgi:hypothetical protein